MLSIMRHSCIFLDDGESGTTFSSGKFGLKVLSKYDILIKNSSDQIIDLSDVNVWQDGQAIN